MKYILVFLSLNGVSTTRVMSVVHTNVTIFAFDFKRKCRYIVYKLRWLFKITKPSKYEMQAVIISLCDGESV